jgi:hypothetical protein
MGSMRRAQREDSYFDYAGLAHEEVTLFMPLSGRRWAWPRTRAFLERQGWPHSQTRLVLLNTSADAEFSADVRTWLAACDYRDVRYIHQPVGRQGLADDNRRDQDVRQEVVKAMWRIYNRLLEMLETEYVWVLEDDIVPPHDVCQRLLRGFDRHTASIAAPYRSRYHAGYVVWNESDQPLMAAGTGREIVQGNGFGCAILRHSALSGHVFSSHGIVQDFDTAFYRKLRGPARVVKVDWSCECEHLQEANDTLASASTASSTHIVAQHASRSAALSDGDGASSIRASDAGEHDVANVTNGRVHKMR